MLHKNPWCHCFCRDSGLDFGHKIHFDNGKLMLTVRWQLMRRSHVLRMFVGKMDLQLIGLHRAHRFSELMNVDCGISLVLIDFL